MAGARRTFLAGVVPVGNPPFDRDLGFPLLVAAPSCCRLLAGLSRCLSLILPPSPLSIQPLIIICAALNPWERVFPIRLRRLHSRSSSRSCPPLPPWFACHPPLPASCCESFEVRFVPLFHITPFLCPDFGTSAENRNFSDRSAPRFPSHIYPGFPSVISFEKSQFRSPIPHLLCTTSTLAIGHVILFPRPPPCSSPS